MPLGFLGFLALVAMLVAGMTAFVLWRLPAYTHDAATHRAQLRLANLLSWTGFLRSRANGLLRTAAIFFAMGLLLAGLDADVAGFGLMFAGLVLALQVLAALAIQRRIRSRHAHVLPGSTRKAP